MSTRRTDARSTSMRPTTTANDYSPSIPLIGGVGSPPRLRRSLYFPTGPNAWGGSRTRVVGLEGPRRTARLPTRDSGHSPAVLEAFPAWLTLNRPQLSSVH